MTVSRNWIPDAIRPMVKAEERTSAMTYGTSPGSAWVEELVANLQRTSVTHLGENATVVTQSCKSCIVSEWSAQNL